MNSNTVRGANKHWPGIGGNDHTAVNPLPEQHPKWYSQAVDGGKKSAMCGNITSLVNSEKLPALRI